MRLRPGNDASAVFRLFATILKRICPLAINAMTSTMSIVDETFISFPVSGIPGTNWASGTRMPRVKVVFKGQK